MPTWRGQAHHTIQTSRNPWLVPHLGEAVFGDELRGEVAVGRAGHAAEVEADGRHGQLHEPRVHLLVHVVVGHHQMQGQAGGRGVQRGKSCLAVGAQGLGCGAEGEDGLVDLDLRHPHCLELGQGSGVGGEQLGDEGAAGEGPAGDRDEGAGPDEDGHGLVLAHDGLAPRHLVEQLRPVGLDRHVVRQLGHQRVVVGVEALQ